MIPGTLSFDAAATAQWDAVVIGAGPAGSVAARELVRRGLKTLLVDKSAFPRAKVCGCCLNGAALSALVAIGLGDLPNRLDAIPLARIRLAAGKKSALIRWPSGASLSREAFDSELVRAAIGSGAEFLPETSAKLAETSSGVHRLIHLRCKTMDLSIIAPVIVIASGLNARLGDSDETAAPPTAGSRIGAGAVLDGTCSDVEPGVVHMAVARGGYVGMVRLEDGRIDAAAAFDSSFVRDSGGLGAAAANVIGSAGLPVPDDLEAAAWRGTPALTRSAKQVAGERWFAVGDAAGYVEPFTGEGIAWAITSGAAVAPRAAAAARGWTPAIAGQWERTYRRLIRARQGTCRAAAAVLRSPRLSVLTVRLLSALPGLSAPVTRALHRPLRLRVESLA